MKLAIMQPYFLPYIGYFQLINAVDKFIFYDDVNFIKNGWINRNRIIINNSIKYITIQLKGASSNKLINEVNFTNNRPKLLQTISMAYKRAPYYDQIIPMIKDILRYETNNIANLAIYSVKKVCEYLDLNTKFDKSSESYSNTRGLDKRNRLIEICKQNGAKKYFNPIGGMKLYNKNDFHINKIELHFLNPNIYQYKQFNNDFFSNLSIVDVLMFNSIDIIHKMLDNYELI